MRSTGFILSFLIVFQCGVVIYHTEFVCTVQSLSKELFHLHSECILMQINTVEKAGIIHPSSSE